MIRSRLRLALLVLAGAALAILGIFGYEKVEQRVFYIANQLLPVRMATLWNSPDNSRLRWTNKCIPVVPGVHAAKWAGGWDTPMLRPPTEGDLGPALLALHIFSIPTPKARARRELIRTHSPLMGVSEEYRHLVDFKFIIGYPREECRVRGRERGTADEAECRGVDEEERAIADEMAHGDLIRLEGLKGGENMDEGKTWEWLRYVGREGAREAQWVFKCDDDNLPILQNLIPFLLTLNPSKPTYIGQPWLENSWYFMLGYMYGMNWGVVKTLATAAVSTEEIQLPIYEDVRMGELMLSLPPIPHHLAGPEYLTPPAHPHHNHHHHHHHHDHDHDYPYHHHGRPHRSSAGARAHRNPYVRIPPPSPRTGLVRIDIRGYLANFGGADSYNGDKAFGWHRLKTDERWLRAWERMGRDLRRVGREVWTAPKGMEGLKRVVI